MLSVQAGIGGAWDAVEGGRQELSVLMGGLGKEPWLRRTPIGGWVLSWAGDTDVVFAAVLELM